eukprot:m.64053 g.64053  ORF g.64053 m.64053 type:complete len:1078 (-) comp15873_c0_seq2:173-3406(-)
MTSALPMTEGPIDIIKLMDDSGFATSILANSQNKNGFPYPRSKSQVSEALVIDPRKDLISTSAILVDLARLRIQALANEIGDTVNASALETTQLALEDVWDDIAVTTRIAASRILDFSPEQMGKLTKLLPWVAIENAVWTYSRCIVATESTEGHGVFTDKANQRRAHATFSVRIEYALSPEELITEAKRMLSGHKDPFQNLAEHYTNLHSRAQPSLALPFLLPASSAPSVPSTKLVAARAAAFSLGHCGREKEATCAVTEEQQGTDLSDYDVLCRHPSGDTYAQHHSVIPLPPPLPTTRDTSGVLIMQNTDIAAPPRISPAPHTPTALEHVSEPDDATDLPLGIAPLLLASSAPANPHRQSSPSASRAEPDNGHGQPRRSPPRRYLHRTRDATDTPNGSHSADSMDFAGYLDEARSYVAAQRLEHAGPPTHNADSDPVYVRRLGTDLKMATPRVADRIPATPTTLQPAPMMYLEFDPQMDPMALRDLDAPLLAEDDVAATFRKIADSVDTSLASWRRKEEQVDWLLPTGARGIHCSHTARAATPPTPGAGEDSLEDHAHHGAGSRAPGTAGGTRTAHGPLHPHTVPARVRRRQPSADVGPPVVSDTFAPRAVLREPSRFEANAIKTGGSAGRSFATRPPKVLAATGASKANAQAAREYAAWKKWWDATVHTDDYLEYVSECQTDFLGVVYGLGAPDAGGNEEEPPSPPDVPTAAEMQHRAHVAHVQGRRRAFTRGCWNTAAVQLGGLGWTPDLDLPLTEGESCDSDDNESIVSAQVHDAIVEENTPAASTGAVDPMQVSSRPSEAEENADEGEPSTAARRRRPHAARARKAEYDALQRRLDTVWLALAVPTVQRMDLTVKYATLPDRATTTASGPISATGSATGSKASAPGTVRRAGKAAGTGARNDGLPAQQSRGPTGEGVVRAGGARERSRRRVAAPLSQTDTQQRLGAPASGALSALRTAVALWEEAGKHIAMRETALGELAAFERHASDPSRHFSRGDAGTAAARLAEEKTRAAFDAKLTKLNADLDVVLRKIRKKYGDDVPYKDVVYREKMRTDRRDVLVALEQERTSRQPE